MVSENTSLLSIVSLRLCRDDVGFIFPVLHEVERVAASALSSLWLLLPDVLVWIPSSFPWHFRPTSAALVEVWSPFLRLPHGALSPSTMIWWGLFCCQVSCRRQQTVPPLARIDHYILRYHQGHGLRVWPSIKHTRVEQNSKNSYRRAEIYSLCTVLRLFSPLQTRNHENSAVMEKSPNWGRKSL